jgi:hypothetical protein
MLLFNTHNLTEFTVETPDGQKVRVVLCRNAGGRINKVGIEAPDTFPISRPGYKAGRGLAHTLKGTDR